MTKKKSHDYMRSYLKFKCCLYSTLDWSPGKDVEDSFCKQIYTKVKKIITYNTFSQNFQTSMAWKHGADTKHTTIP